MQLIIIIIATWHSDVVVFTLYGEEMFHLLHKLNLRYKVNIGGKTVIKAVIKRKGPWISPQLLSKENRTKVDQKNP